METKDGSLSYEAFPMKGGDGEYSYSHNSTLQQGGAYMAKNMIKEAIIEKLDLQALLEQRSLDVFRIVDLGCSVGPNTFFAVQNIIEAVNLKLLQSNQQYGLDLNNPLEFQVFFNDHFGNDFNTLFKSFPIDKQYYVAAVPGSFHNRLFPNSSIHIFHLSFALGYLSKVPMEIVDKHSPAYNKGSIHFASANKEVQKAYSAQFGRDMENFLNVRASEIVCGGLMALLISCLSPESNDDKGRSPFRGILSLLEDVLHDLKNKGLVSEELVDSFNLPHYLPTPEEVKELIETNGNFKIENLQALASQSNNLLEMNALVFYKHLRAAWEGIFKQHFGEEVAYEIFESFKKKVAQSTITNLTYKPWAVLFVVKRIESACD